MLLSTSTSAAIDLLASDRNRACSSLRCSASCVFFCSVMSRAIFEAPITLPYSSLTSDMVSDTSTRVPSRRMRTVSK